MAVHSSFVAVVGRPKRSKKLFDTGAKANDEDVGKIASSVLSSVGDGISFGGKKVLVVVVFTSEGVERLVVCIGSLGVSFFGFSSEYIDTIQHFTGGVEHTHH